jgi:hypothetical protein
MLPALLSLERLLLRKCRSVILLHNNSLNCMYITVTYSRRVHLLTVMLVPGKLAVGCTPFRTQLQESVMDRLLLHLLTVLGSSRGSHSRSLPCCGFCLLQLPVPGVDFCRGQDISASRSPTSLALRAALGSHFSSTRSAHFWLAHFGRRET